LIRGKTTEERKSESGLTQYRVLFRQRAGKIVGGLGELLWSAPPPPPSWGRGREPTRMLLVYWSLRVTARHGSGLGGRQHKCSVVSSSLHLAFRHWARVSGQGEKFMNGCRARIGPHTTSTAAPSITRRRQSCLKSHPTRPGRSNVSPISSGPASGPWYTARLTDRATGCRRAASHSQIVHFALGRRREQRRLMGGGRWDDLNQHHSSSPPES
jgi:hypothetical protein